MFGKKKKKKEEEADAVAVEEGRKETGKEKKKKEKTDASVDEDGGGKKKTFFTLKKLIFLSLFLLSVGIAGFTVYKLYYQEEDGVITYTEKELVNITLSEEVIRFSFDYMMPLYDLMITFNGQISMMEAEIQRINALSEQFPDQKKITEKEIKVWSKEKDKLKKAFEKFEKKLEALYVSYRVNQENGLTLVDEQKGELTEGLEESLKGALALTERLKVMNVEVVPEGFIKGNIYKIKKKVSEFL